MELDHFVVAMRSLTWLVFTAFMWLGLNDYFEKKGATHKKRWKILRACLMLVLLGNFVIFAVASLHGIGVV